MSKKILVLSNKSDAHTDSVIAQLYDTGNQVVRLNTEDFRNYTINVLGVAGQWSILTPEGRIVDPRTIDSVYVRRVTPALVTDIDEKFREFTVNEVAVLIDALPALLVDTRWMDNPNLRKVADNKLFQLRIAKQCGLSIPETLVTNEWKSLMNFMHGRRVVYKTLYIPVVDLGDNGVSVINTTLLTEEHLEQLKTSLYLCPSLFQEYIEKEYELRIHVIGNEVVAIGIDSQSTPSAKVDWRMAQFDTLSYKEVCLPGGIQGQILSFVKTLGLNFGIIDMIVTPDGQYVFLEINTNGNWLWIERILGVEISGRIAKWLSCDM